MQTATYSAPSGPGELYLTHSPGFVTTAWPALTSSTPPSCSTRIIPLSTTVISSNSGRWPGSRQPAGDTIRATLRFKWPEFTRPAYSSIRFGGVPAALITEGAAMTVGMGNPETITLLLRAESLEYHRRNSVLVRPPRPHQRQPSQ